MMALIDLPSKDPTIKKVKEAMAKLNGWLARPEKYAKVPLLTEILTAIAKGAHRLDGKARQSRTIARKIGPNRRASVHDGGKSERTERRIRTQGTTPSC
jgi:hypothetical protein